jgi:hypothetical protein
MPASLRGASGSAPVTSCETRSGGKWHAGAGLSSFGHCTTPHEVCDCPHQAAHYHIVGVHLWHGTWRKFRFHKEHDIHLVQRSVCRDIGPYPHPGSSSDQVMWNLWSTKWHCGRFCPSTSVSPANSHSTDCSTLIIIYHPGLAQ